MATDACRSAVELIRPFYNGQILPTGDVTVVVADIFDCQNLAIGVAFEYGSVARAGTSKDILRILRRIVGWNSLNRTNQFMKICAFIHLFRCLEPCGGVGRHANSILARLAKRPSVELSLLLNRKYRSPGGDLPETFPLRDLPFDTYPGSELWIEKANRSLNLPKMDRWSPGADWYYSPMEGRLPVRNGRNATTIHDVQALETGLPWSNTPEHQRFRRKWRYWLPRAFRTVDRILTVSEFSKQRMIELLGAPEEKIAVVGNAVDDKFFEAGDRAAGNVEKSPEVVVVGGLRYKKGADHIFRVADMLRRMESPLRIVALGQHDPEYVERARGHPQMDSVEMLPDAALVDRVSAATALLLLSEYEGFGIPALEAMACGTPAAVSNRGSLPEVVGEAGWVAEPSNVGEIAEWLDHLRPGSREYEAIVERGRLHARLYTWDRCVDRLIEVFSEQN